MVILRCQECNKESYITGAFDGDVCFCPYCGASNKDTADAGELSINITVLSAEELAKRDKLTAKQFKLTATKDKSAFVLTKCKNKKIQQVEIPESYQGKPIVAIGERAFFGCTALETVRIPECVTHIGRAAFCECASLRSVQLPPNLQRIALELFARCLALEMIVLPESVTEIGGSAFQGCNRLQNVVFGEKVTVIGSYAFSGCTSLSCAILPSTVTEIGYYAFWSCFALERVELGVGLQEINGGAFLNCTNLNTIVFQGTQQAFWNIRRAANCWQYVPAKKVACCNGNAIL